MSSPPPSPSPSPSPSYSTAIFAVNAVILFFTTTLLLPIASSHSCGSSRSETSRSSSCPPFTTSSLSFPFSSSPGCGHPLFHIKCGAPHSLITINDLSFSLLRYEPNSSSLSLSPQPSVSSTNTSTTTAHRNCSSAHFLSIPRRSISLSGTPFRVSEASCSRLSVLRPCPPPNLPNCSHCPWECKLIKNPVQLLRECGSAHRSVSEQGCQGDVLGYLDDFLKFGIEIEWDEDQDSYFSSCKSCQAKHGVCGFNSSDPNKR